MFIKKITFLIILLFIFNINALATSGPISEANVTTCNNKTYGFHGTDKHYHEILDNSYYGAGANLGIINPCLFIDNKIAVSLASCIDGDSAKFKVGNTIFTTRFLAIDTPETKHPTKDEEPWGKEASNLTCNSLITAKNITLELDQNSAVLDKYNRYLVWVYVDDELLQTKLLQNGYAKVAYLYGKYEYTSYLQEIEQTAKDAKLGIWSGEEPPKSIIDIIVLILKLLLEFFK